MALKKFDLTKKVINKLFNERGKEYGAYIIYLKDYSIQYPKKKSRIIYIGKSAAKSRAKGIYSRLLDHVRGQGNENPLTHAYINNKKQCKFQLFISPLRKAKREEEKLLKQFISDYGVFPVGNQQPKSISKAIKKPLKPGKKEIKPSDLIKLLKRKLHKFPVYIYRLVYDEVIYKAKILKSGKIKIVNPNKLKPAQSLSGAARSITGNYINGWDWWYYKGKDGYYYPMDNLR